MKKFRMILMAALAMCTVALTSCTKDNAADGDDVENTENGGGQNNAPQGMANMQITETDNQIVATWSEGVAGYSMVYKWIFDFDANDICIRASYEITFPTADAAQIAYREALQEENEGYEISLHGKTLVIVYRESDYEGSTKEDIRLALEIMKTGTLPDNYGGGGDNDDGDDNGDGDDDDMIVYDDPSGIMPAGTTYWSAASGDETGVEDVSLVLTKLEGNKYSFALGLTGHYEGVDEEFSDYYTGTVYFSPYTGSGTVYVNYVAGRLTRTSDARVTININTADEIEISYNVNGLYGATLEKVNYGK